MLNAKPLDIILQVGLEDGDAEDLDQATRQLLDELMEQPLESVDLVVAGETPVGAKAADPITIGALWVAVLPSFLPKLVDFIQAWTLRGQGRTVKFKGKVGRDDVEFEGSAQDLKMLLTMLSNLPQSGNQTSDKPD